MEKLLSLLTSVKPYVDEQTFLDSSDLYLEGILDSVDILVILDEIGNAYGVNIGPMDFTRNDFKTVAGMHRMIARFLEK